MTWFDILKVEDEFTSFEEWIESLNLPSAAPLLETVNNLIERARSPYGVEPEKRAVEILEGLTDAYGNRVREFLEGSNPEAHEKGKGFLRGVVDNASYAEFQEDVIRLTPTWLNMTFSGPSPYKSVAQFLLRNTCINESEGESAYLSDMPIIQITLDTVNLEVHYIMSDYSEVEVCLHRNLLPSGDQLGFLVLAAENHKSWMQIWE